jgi:hypothetical protein
MIQPPFQIVAAGICPQNLSPSDIAPNTCLCVVQRGTTGIWTILADDPTVVPGNSVLILSPGGASNLAEGISFGQSSQAGALFSFESYRNDTGAPVDVEVQFIIVKFPSGE